MRLGFRYASLGSFLFFDLNKGGGVGWWLFCGFVLFFVFFYSLTCYSINNA